MSSTILVFLCTLVALKQTNAGTSLCADTDNDVLFAADTVRDFGDKQECSGYPLYDDTTDRRLCGWLDGVGAETFCWEQEENDETLHGYDTRNYHCIPEKAAGEGVDVTEGDYSLLVDGVTDFECAAGSDSCFLECKGLNDGQLDIEGDAEINTKCNGNPFDIAVACVDVDECRDGAIRFCTGPSHARDCEIGPACGPNTKCTNSVGDYQCVCINGFEATGTNQYDITVGCTDVDECAGGDCPAPHRCHNTIGSYYCECAYGFVWDEATESCMTRECDEPADIDNALLAGPLAPNDFEDDRMYTCEDGFEPSYRVGDDFTLSCRPDGRWCHCQAPGCRRKSCGIPHYDGNAVTDKISGVFGDWLTYTCEEGFDVEGESFYKIKCQNSGQWEVPVPDERCEDSDECEEADACPDGADCVNTIGSFHCLCKLGYMQAQPQGEQCDKISCGDIPAVAHGERLTASSAGDNLFGSTIMYRCDEGYRVSTKNTPTQATQEFEITCTLDGTWNPFPVPECIPISCGDPGIVDYSVRLGPFFYYQRVVTYTCLDGFRPSDNNGLLSMSFTIQCQDNGQWTERAHCVNVNECKEKDAPCGFPDEQYCIDTIGDYICTCPPGYRLDRTGRDCEELPKEEKTNPAGSVCGPFKFLGICNMGTCIYDGQGLPSCRCDPGFKGAFCDKEIGPQFTLPYILNLSSIAVGSIVVIVCIALMCYVCCKHMCKINRRYHDHDHDHDHDHVYDSPRPGPFPKFQLPTRMGHKMMFSVGNQGI